MLAKELFPSAIPDLRSSFGRVHDIGEQDGGENAIRLGSAAHPCQESLHLLTKGISIPRPRHVIVAGKLQVCCPWDVFRAVAAMLDVDGPISNAVHHKRGNR